MLAIRMQRTGRSGHAQFRVIVQEARLTPTSGKVVAYLGNYNPHSKAAVLKKDKAAFYLEHGAQPSDRVARLLKQEGVKLPDWVKVEQSTNKRAVRNPDKLRRNRPAEEAAPAEPAAAKADTVEAPAADATTEKEETRAKEAAPEDTTPLEDKAAPADAKDEPEQVATAEPAAADTPGEVAAEDTATEEKA